MCRHSVEVVIKEEATRTLVLGVEVQRKAVQGASVGEEVAIALEDVDGSFPFGGDVVRGCQ